MGLLEKRKIGLWKIEWKDEMDADEEPKRMEYQAIFIVGWALAGSIEAGFDVHDQRQTSGEGLDIVLILFSR